MLQNNFEKKGNDKRKQSIMLTAVIAILLLITGTFAWRDYRQHKSNVMSGKGFSRDVVLVEDFDETSTNDWIASKDDNGKGINKNEVHVRNMGDGLAFVRLTLSEYMEIADTNQNYSNLRYMIDMNGNFISIPVIGTTDVIAAMKEELAKHPEIAKHIDQSEDAFTVAAEDQHDLDETARIHKVENADGEERYYIATQEFDPNGQYGKHIVLSQKSLGNQPTEESEIITGGGVDNDTRPNANDLHHDEDDQTQCELFETILIQDRLQNRKQNHAAKYVDLISNKKIIPISEFVTGSAEAEAGQWIYADDGYIYYSRALTPFVEDTENLGTSRSINVLDALELIEQPDGAFMYQLHIDLEAISLDEIVDSTDWDNIPQDLEDYWTEQEDSFVGNEGSEESNSIKPELQGEAKPGEDIIIYDNEGDAHDFRIIKNEDDNLYIISKNRIIEENVFFNSAAPYDGYEGSLAESKVKEWFKDFDKSLDGYVLESTRKSGIDKRQGVIELKYFSAATNYENIVGKAPQGASAQYAFVPNVSDIKTPESSELFTFNDFYWLSNIGNHADRASRFTDTGLITAAHVASEAQGLRAAMWINIAE